MVLAEKRIGTALGRTGRADAVIEHRLLDVVATEQMAAFAGSPTILIDGRDPFAAPPAAPVGLSCRLYETPVGVAGAPTVEQLVEVMS